MQKKLIIATSIFVLLLITVTILFKYPKHCPDGRVPRNNDIGLCPEEIPSDMDKGIERSYSSFVCIEFKDKSKNYVPGEVIIGLNAQVQVPQVQKLLAEMNTYIQKEDPEYKITLKQEILEDTAYLLEVPRGWESNIINKFMENSQVEYAELNGCAQISSER